MASKASRTKLEDNDLKLPASVPAMMRSVRAMLSSIDQAKSDLFTDQVTNSLADEYLIAKINEDGTWRIRPTNFDGSPTPDDEKSSIAELREHLEACEQRMRDAVPPVVMRVIDRERKQEDQAVLNGGQS